jgi:hypothetical protein
MNFVITSCKHLVQARSSFVLKMVSSEPVFVKAGLRGPGIDSVGLGIDSRAP